MKNTQSVRQRERRRVRRLAKERQQIREMIYLFVVVFVLSMTAVTVKILSIEEELDKRALKTECTINTGEMKPITSEEDTEVIEVINVEESVINTSSLLNTSFADIPVDDELRDYISKVAISNNIPVEIMFALAERESSFNPNAKSATNDHGLFQINACNFGWIETTLGIENLQENIYDPYINTDCAALILTTYKDNYSNQNWHHVLMRYNMGPKGAQDCFNVGRYSSEYSRTIIDTAETLGLSNISL